MKIEKEEFEQLIEQHRGVIERLVYYKIPIKEDAEDILQDIWLIAYEKVNLLREKQLFKAWLIKIAMPTIVKYSKAMK
jgi:RNA polymerase sigma-70 factor (ECF subfamily)